MIIYTLSQKVEVAVDRKEWVDIATNQFSESLRDFAKTIKEHNPNAVLGLRRIEEMEIEI